MTDNVDYYLARRGDTGQVAIAAFRNVDAQQQAQAVARFHSRAPQDYIVLLPKDAIPQRLIDLLADQFDADPWANIAAVPVALIEISTN